MTADIESPAPTPATVSAGAPWMAGLRPLEAKPDWPAAARRWVAFWNDEVPEDRVLMAVRVRRDCRDYPAPAPPADAEAWHTDLDFFLRRRLHEVMQYEYLAEAIPSTWISITGAYLGILLGGRLRAMDNGVIHSDPCIDDWSAVDRICVDRQSRWYDLSMRQLELLSRHADKFVIRMPDFHGVSDALCALRGGTELALDLCDCPETIHRAAGQIVSAWQQAWDEAHTVLARVQPGTCIWLGMWHPGRLEVIQEDFADNLSVEQYREHFLPHDRLMARTMDRTMFHLHNTMMRYQEVVLTTPEISGGQFSPPRAAGTMDALPLSSGLDMFWRLQEAGKKVWYLFRDEEDMCTAILNGDPRHLLLFSPVLGKRCEADRLMHLAEVYTRQRRKELGLN